ncbi:MAG: hypothetical protein IJ679_09645 [Lachnospiraceae bacterium]|nr:hypothetical protein [Lachnospiraceae bacterium]
MKFKKVAAVFLAGMLACSTTACGGASSEEGAGTQEQSETDSASTEAESTEEESTDASEEADAEGTDTETTEEEDTAQAEGSAVAMGTVANTLAEDKEALVADYADKFEQKEYADAESGLSITYNLYLPEDYDESASYPMVVFIGDASCVGDDPTVSLTQGRGGLVWATKEWQTAYPTIVAVPTYPETILDDHNGYTTTEYVELTKRYIDYMSEEYAVDTNRIYGTGQSMGCMTSLILASEYPDLYAGCMFVDGQWDASTLSGLENQTFVYFAAEDDTSAWNGSQEVQELFDTDSTSYAYEQWDGNWSVDELSDAAEKLFVPEEKHYFISWATGTIEPKSGGMGGAGGPGGPRGNGGAPGMGEPPADGEAPEMGEKPADGEAPEMGEPPAEGEAPEIGEPPAEGEAPETGEPPVDGASGEKPAGMGQNGGGMGGGASYHMASFDYAYN